MQIGFGSPPTGKWQSEMIERVAYLGDWLKVNGEAIYKTRPWKRWNEGKTIRFTRSKDDKYIYAISLEWPGDKLTLRSVRPQPGSSITMLGWNGLLRWEMNDSKELTVVIPAELQNPPVVPVFRLTPSKSKARSRK